MAKARMYHDLKSGAFIKATNPKDKRGSLYLVQRRAGSRVGVVGLMIELPYVLISYRSVDGVAISAKLTVDSGRPDFIEAVVELQEKVKSILKRCEYIPFLRGLAKRVESIHVVTKYIAISESSYQRVAQEVAEEYCCKAQNIVFDS